MPSKPKPRLAYASPAKAPPGVDQVVKAVHELGLANGPDVLEHLRKGGSKLSRASVFRHLEAAAQQGKISLVELGPRARYFHRAAETAVFAAGGLRPRPVTISEDLVQALQKLKGAKGREVFVLVH